MLLGNVILNQRPTERPDTQKTIKSIPKTKITLDYGCQAWDTPLCDSSHTKMLKVKISNHVLYIGIEPWFLVSKISNISCRQYLIKYQQYWHIPVLIF